MNGTAESLVEKFHDKSATTAFIGQGYVGLPLALEFAEAGFETLGIDVSDDHVRNLEEGRSNIVDVDDERLQKAVKSGRYEPTTDYAAASEADAVFICVPTPLSKTREPDLSYIRSAAESLRPHLEGPTLVVLESTTYPGTTEEVLVPLLTGNEDEAQLDDELFIAFSPERVDPANEDFGIENTPKIVGGVTETSGQLAQTLYEQVVDEIHPVDRSQEAEMVKLLENTFRAVNIALVNEMAIMCDRMDIDIWEVIDAAATKPFGFMPFYPGPGIGGHCIPLDPSFLSWKAKDHGFHNQFIELATDLNSDMPRFVVQKATRLLNEIQKPINGSNILLVGMAYKPNVNDLRQSPAIDIWELLDERGANLQYHDPYVPSVPQLDGAESVALDDELLGEQDLVIITTDHDDIDFDELAERAELVFDTRDSMEGEFGNVTRL
jgi:UDP-N-acetyl-D-glucosamine dehydrogenase